MLKFLSELVGLKILLFQEKAVYGPVTGYLINHEDGKLVGLFTRSPLDKKEKFIQSTEIKGVGDDFVLIDSVTTPSDPAEIIKLRELLEVHPLILGETVKTESGRRVGRVKDAAISLRSLRIEKLYINSWGSLKALTKEIILPAKNIVRIEKKVIFVTDLEGRAKIKALGVKIGNPSA